MEDWKSGKGVDWLGAGTPNKSRTLLKLSTIVLDIMATVNFSVPEDVKRDFNETFKGRNKSAIIADLMRRAVDEAEREERRMRAIDVLLGLREEATPVSADEIRSARDETRQ